MQKWAKHNGFTIVELLIVIVIIGILAAITVVAYNGIQNRAKVQQANADLNSLVKAINLARINESKPLIQVTETNCTGCFDQARYELSLDLIGTAAGVNLSALKKGNPWGNKYYLDENEMENGSCVNKDGLGVGAGVPSGVTGISVPSVSFYSCPG